MSLRPVARPLMVTLAIGCAAVATPEAMGQALEELRTDVRTSNPGEPAPPADPNPRERRDPSGCDDDSMSGDDLFGVAALTGLAITSPFWGPPVWVGDTYRQPGYFAHYPYQYGEGYMMIGPPEAAGIAGPRQPYATALRARTEYGTDFDDIQWIGGHLLFETSPRWGLESDFRYVREDVRPAFNDSLWLGDANVVFRFAQSEFLVMRTGLGFNYLADRDGADFGFNFTYGGDFFPVPPLIVSAELDLGTLGHTHVYHFRATLGANRGVTEAFIGYDYYDIGPTQVAGLVAGVRLWY